MKPLLTSFLVLMAGLAISIGFTYFLGENPVEVLLILLRGAFGSWTGIGYVLFYATPLMFTGLSVSWALKAGLFNIGAEGQMAIGGVAMTSAAIWLGSTNPYFAWPIAVLIGAVSGGLWGGLAGLARAYRGTHEVLATILLNYIAYGVVGYLILFPLRNVESQTPETLPINESLRFVSLGGGNSPLNFSLLIAFAVLSFSYFILLKTKFGYQQRISGSAPQAARRSGINLNKQIVLSMMVSGAFSALAAMNEIFGASLKLKEGFTSGVGFLGIAVALLGRHHPVGIALAAILFGALQKGALDLDLDTKYVSKDLSLVIQAVVILLIATQNSYISFVKAKVLKWKS